MMILTRRAMGASTMALLAGCATGAATSTTEAPAPARPPAAIGAWGVDLSARDLNVKPGDDFFRYANGTWLANTEIPADRTRWGTFDMLGEKSDRDVRDIITAVAGGSNAPGSNAQKIADIYNSYLDIDHIDQVGLAPIQPTLAQIDALRTTDDVVRFMCTPASGASAPIRMFITLDQKNPDRYIVAMTQSGLGLPEREYYRRTDGQFPTLRTQYGRKR
jgi:putative endopeptidase